MRTKQTQNQLFGTKPKAPNKPKTKVEKVEAVVLEEEEPLEEVSEEGTTEESPPAAPDLFLLKTGGIFDKEDIVRIDLPKFILSNSMKNVSVYEEKSPIALTLVGHPSIGRKVVLGIKNGFKEFKLQFLNEDGEVESVWEFEGARIKAADFDFITTESRPEPRTIQVEIEYANLTIDKESIN